MSRHRLAAAGMGFVLGLMVPVVANADSRCARGGDFCLGSATLAAATIQADASGWGQWASGSRMRPGGPSAASERRAVEGDEAEAQPVNAGRVSLDATALGVRLQPRAAYGGLQSLDPDAGVYASYSLSDAFSLDLTAGRGRIGLRAVAPDPAYGGTGPGFPSGPAFDRTAWSVALNAARQIGAFGIGGRIGYVDVRDHPELPSDVSGSTLRLGSERTTSVRRSFLGVDASYDIARNWQLHGGAMYRRDEGRSSVSPLSGLSVLQAAGDEKEWGVGVRYYGWRNFKLNVEYLKTSGRDQFGNEALLFLGRFDF